MFTLKYLNQICGLVGVCVGIIKQDYWLSLMIFLCVTFIDHIIDLTAVGGRK